MTKKDVFRRLAKHLDDLPGGFPATDSGVELRILRRLFTEEEAELALLLSLILEEPASVAKRARMSIEETAEKLESMAKKGLIYRFETRSGDLKYRANQYVIGIWEFQVNNLNPDLIRDMDEYMPILLELDMWKTNPQLRTVPINQSIPVQKEILAHENAEAMVRAHDRFLVAPCICRRERKMVGEGCDKPEEACLVLGKGVDYYEKNGMGRVIDRDEALSLLKTADEAGLVLQPSNAKKIANICMCCGCCCGVLRTIKKHPQPAQFVSTPFRLRMDVSRCIACGVCVSRCPMEALVEEEGGIRVDLDRCIGCGLCVSTCTSQASSLERKPESEQPEVPGSLTQTYLNLARKRGKLKPVDLAKAWIKTKSRVRAKG
ncbi:MAG: 4Fe-4S binding protein [Acidobacteriota bacterium]